MEEPEETIKALKSKKSPGLDGIHNELYKHTPKIFLYKLLNFLNICWIYGEILEEWRTAVEEIDTTRTTIEVLVY